MATLKVVGSGSQQGNTYFLETSNGTLILDLGCKWSEILERLNYKIENVCGYLVTHIHSDHSKSIPNALKYGLNVFSNQDVADKFQGVKALKPKTRYKIGGFYVMPLEVKHNVPNFAYIIEHEEIGKLVFATDLTHFPYKVKGVNNLLIEANYSNDIVIDHIMNGYEIRSQNQYHMEFEDTIECIKNNMSSELNNIVLIHLSNNQSDERMFKQMVLDEFGIMPYVADKGLEVTINKEDF